MSQLIRTGGATAITIANGETTSAAIASDRTAMYGLIFPASMTSTNLQFTVCGSLAGTYVALCDSTGTLVSMTIASSRAYDLPSALAPWPFFKIVLGTAETGAKVLTLCAKG